MADFNDPIPRIMGILNVTPDSFSDGGRFSSVGMAVQHGIKMAEEGADFIDVGGESTRPGSCPVPVELQLGRVLPVIEELAQHLRPGCEISVDTTRRKVAEAAVHAGASVINDISAGRDDSGMFDFVACHRVAIVLMHMQGRPETMQARPIYEDVVGEAIDFLMERTRRAMEAGIPQEKIIIDPGIGFGKRREDNLALIGRIDEFVATGFPVLLGASRKRFMGAVCRETEPKKLVGATVATTMLGALKGVRLFRVHDVRENRQALDVVTAIDHVMPGFSI